MEKYLTSFKSYLKNDGRSLNTVLSYQIAVQKFFDWYCSRFGKFPAILIKENIMEYVDELKGSTKNGKRLSSKTINARLNGLKAFNEYLIDEEKMREIVIPKKAFEKTQANIVSPAKFHKRDMDKFVQTILEESYLSNNKDSYRNYCLVQLLINTGLRISEATNLKIEDIDLENKELFVRNGKGNKSRIVYMNEKLLRVIETYLMHCRLRYHHANDSNYLFLSNRNIKLSRITVNKLFQKYSRKSGLKEMMSPHDCRHYFCSNSLSSNGGGLSLHEVSSLAGHSSINTTSIYLHTDKEEILNKMNKA
jgi:integrase/recombinase XerD